MQSIYPSVESSIKSLPYADKNLILTGHSRGGALAVLMAQFLYTKYADVDDEMIPDQIYTFGAPRVGDIDFYHNYDLRAQTRLFINEGDPVPTTPPTSTGFYHVHEQYLMLRNSVNEVDMDQALTQSSFYDAYVRIKAGGPDFGDHSLTKGYIPNIKRNLGW